MNINVYLKRLLNGANIFLLCLILWLAWFINYQVSNTVGLEYTDKIAFRVVKKEIDNFKRIKYIFWHSNNFWLGESKQDLDLGKEYLGELAIFRYNYFESQRYLQYSLSYGLAGSSELLTLIGTIGYCDIICGSYNFLQEVRQYANQIYINKFCGLEKTWFEYIFSDGCKDIAILSKGLVFGGSTDFSSSTKENLKKLGLSHLVAVSGFQVVLLINFVEIWLKKIPRRSFRWVCSVSVIISFIVLVGPDPPVLRSSISVLISIFSLNILGRKLATWRALVYSAILMLLVNPLYAFSISFQLSFSATAGLLFTSSLITKDSSVDTSKLSQIWENFVSSCLAFLFTLPIISNLNSQFSLFGVVINTFISFIIPTISIANILGLIPFVGEISLWMSGFWQAFFLSFIDWAGTLPSLSFTSIGHIEAVFYYSTMIVLIKTVNFWINKNLPKREAKQVK